MDEKTLKEIQKKVIKLSQIKEKINNYSKFIDYLCSVFKISIEEIKNSQKKVSFNIELSGLFKPFRIRLSLSDIYNLIEKNRVELEEEFKNS